MINDLELYIEIQNNTIVYSILSEKQIGTGEFVIYSLYFVYVTFLTVIYEKHKINLILNANYQK